MALKELEGLSKSYPDDPKLKKYAALCYLFQEKYGKAEKILKDLVSLYPDRADLIYFLGVAYVKNAKPKEASEQFAAVMSIEPKSVYSEAASNFLSQVNIRLRRKQRFNVLGAFGYEFDTNAILRPTQKDLLGSGDQNAGRFVYTLDARANLKRTRKDQSRLGYSIYQSFHERDLNNVNYTLHDVYYSKWVTAQCGKQPVDLGFYLDTAVGLLQKDLFSFGKRVRFDMQSSFTKMTRTLFYQSVAHIGYGPDGQEPRLTSRDGVYTVTGLRQRFYLKDYLNYFYVGYEFQNAFTRGDNYDYMIHRPFVGYSALLLRDIRLDISGSYEFTRYPHYSSELFPDEPEARKGNNLFLFGMLTIPFDEHWSLQLRYRFADAKNRNDLYQYSRHIAGARFTFAY